MSTHNRIETRTELMARVAPEDNIPLFDEGDDDDPPSDGGYDEDEGISYNADDDDAANDSNDADISYDGSEEVEETHPKMIPMMSNLPQSRHFLP